MAAQASTSKDAYIFQRSTNATSRLNYQYYLWQDTLGFHLHPSIPPLNSDARVADVATGSGIWLYDVSRQVPSSTSLTGCDISLEQIPNQTFLSPKFVFHTWNLFEPPPPELQRSFDIVHMRLIAVVIKDGDANKILENVKMLLKPSGYLQWEEQYTADAKVLTGSGQITNECDGLGGLRDILSEPIKSTSGQLLVGPRDWLKTLNLTLQSQGFEDVQRYLYQDNPHMGLFWTDMYIASVKEFALQMLEKDTELALSVKEIIKKANIEKQMGAWVSNPKGVWIGRWNSKT